MTNPLSADLDHILEHTRDLWDELRGERIFITGGTGFFGCWLLESFLWANDRLNLDSHATVLSRSPDLFRAKAPHLAGHKTVSVIQGDIRTFDFPAGTFSHMIHAATESSTSLGIENPLLMLNTILDGTQRALQFAKKGRVTKFLFTSSGAVYGRQPAEITHVSEDFSGAPDPLDPRLAYGQGKRTAEQLCAIYNSHELEIKIARCFAFVGPYLPLDVHFAIGNFVRDAMKGGPIIVRGDGSPQRSYLYAADLVIWLWTVLLRGAPCRAYNIGSEESLSIAETAQSIAGCFTPSLKVEILGSRNPAKSTECYVPLTMRAKEELGLKQHICLTDGIQRTIAFHQRLSNG